MTKPARTKGQKHRAASHEKPISLEAVLASERANLRAPSSMPASGSGLDAAAGASERSPSALCLSGGGIRSATFGLGVLQGLAGHHLIERFDYLSTVSGGGYIGSWLTAWKHRAGGLDRVAPRLRTDAPPIEPGELDPIGHLRDYSRFLSPRTGAFSTDVWTLASTVLRNMLLNWLVLIPLLMAVLMLPRIFLSVLASPEYRYGADIFVDGARNYSAPELNAISESALVAYGLPGLSMALFTCALFFTLRYLPGVGNREHGPLDYLARVLIPLSVSVLSFLAFDSLGYLGSRYVDESNVADVVGWTIVPCVCAGLLHLMFHGGSVRERLSPLNGPLPVAILAMAAGTGLAAWFATNFLLWDPDPKADISYATYVTIGPGAILLGFGLGTVLFVGLASAVLRDEDLEWMSRAVAGVLMVSFAWTAFSGAVLLLPQWAYQWDSWGHAVLASVGGVSAWIGSRREPQSASLKPSAGGRKGSSMLAWAGKIAPVVFLILLAGALSTLTNLLLVGMHALTHIPLQGPHGEPIAWTYQYGMLTRSSPLLVVALAVGLLGISGVMSRFVNANVFSLHGMYRDRLVRAYLGASNPARDANRFTGFSRTDDLAMGSLDPRLPPFHVLNLTLNLVATSRLSWQQRKAESFTVSPLHCGSALLGYRSSAEYAGRITLGTAAALSGAAASPNMGSFSSPVVGFIMTLFNTRLGAWLGNPGSPGEGVWRRPGPLSPLRSLLREALGQTSDNRRFVYLSDGGHFENLGLYEMVRRRCRVIVVIDASCDPDLTFTDLGNALRKIRIDFGIPIEFDDALACPLRQRQRRCALGRIRYSALEGGGEDGRLLFIKPLFLGGEPPDLLSYQADHPSFPHQSTADQWFDEAQTESYRSLGQLTIDEICAGWDGGTLTELCDHVERAYLGAPGAANAPV